MVVVSNLPFLNSGRNTHEGGDCTAILASCMFEDETLELRRKAGLCQHLNVLIEGETLEHRKAGFRQRLIVLLEGATLEHRKARFRQRLIALLDGESQTLDLRQNGRICHWQCLIIRPWTRGGPCPFLHVEDVLHFREHS